MRFSKKTFSIFLAFLLSTQIAFAHPGRTNSEGCHTNKKTGEYHCHNKAKVSAKQETRKAARTSARGFSKSYICDFNFYNCSDFSDGTDAQNAFEFCMEKTGSDIHDLDRDNDSLACETLSR